MDYWWKRNERRLYLEKIQSFWDLKCQNHWISSIHKILYYHWITSKVPLSDFLCNPIVKSIRKWVVTLSISVGVNLIYSEKISINKMIVNDWVWLPWDTVHGFRLLSTGLPFLDGFLGPRAVEILSNRHLSYQSLTFRSKDKNWNPLNGSFRFDISSQKRILEILIKIIPNVNVWIE